MSNPSFAVKLLLAVTLALPGSLAWAQTGLRRGDANAVLSVEDALQRGFVALDRLEHDETIAEDEMTGIAAEALQVAEYVRKVDPLNVSAGYIVGRLAILANRPRDAIPKIEAYINDPVGASDWYAYKLLGDIYVVSYAQFARSSYKTAVELAPNEPEALIGLARADLKLSRTNEVIDNAREAIRLDGESRSEYRAVLAEAYLLEDRLEEAYQAAEDSVLLAERALRENQVDESRLIAARQRYELLIRCLQGLVTQYPERAKYVTLLVRALQDKADLARLASYQQVLALISNARQFPAIEQSTDVADLLYEQARLYRILGRDLQAVQLLGQVLAKDAAHAPAKALLEVIMSEGKIKIKTAEDKTASAG